MRKYVVAIGAALLALVMGSGLHAEKNVQRVQDTRAASKTSVVSFVQGQPGRPADAESMAQFLKGLGHNDVKLITPSAPNERAYCLLNYQGKLAIKAYAFPDEPIVEFYVELKVPAKVSAGGLLKVLQLTRNWAIYHRPFDNKIVIESRVFSKDIGNVQKILGNLYQVSLQAHAGLNTKDDVVIE